MPINTEIEDKKTKFNLNNKNILLHSSITFPFYPDLGEKLVIWILGGYSVTSDLDLGKKVGNLDFRGGVFCNFGFGLREKSWKFGFWGGYSVTSDLDLGKKVGNLDFRGGGGYSVTSDLDLGKRLEIWIFGGGIL